MPKTSDGGWILDDREVETPRYTNMKTATPTLAQALKMTDRSKFALGEIKIEGPCLALADEHTLGKALMSHMNGEWGEEPEAVRRLNEATLLTKGGKLFTSFTDPKTNRPVAIITDRDDGITVIGFNDDLG